MNKFPKNEKANFQENTFINVVREQSFCSGFDVLITHSVHTLDSFLCNPYPPDYSSMS